MHAQVKQTKSAKNAELKAEQDKIKKLETHDLSYFPGKNGFVDDVEKIYDGFEKIFVFKQYLIHQK